MYPRNAASPERIAIGAVVQISDGAVQTTGITITVRGQGGAEGTGGGTSAVGASGIVYYTPTQAETNFTSFVVIASKTGCIPVAQTIITTASSTAGQVVVGTNNDKTGYSLTATTGLGNQTADITGNLSGSVGSVTGLTASNLDATVSSRLASASYTAPDNAGIAAILDDTGTSGVVVAAASKTGYSLTAATGLGNQTANITGNLSGSVGSVTGAVTVGTNNDKSGYSLAATGLDAITESATGMVEIAKVVWNRLRSALTTTDSIGQGLAREVDYGSYQNGAVWYDNVGGTPGAVSGVNGTNRNPVNNETDLNTLLTNLNLARVEMAPGSAITFTTAHASQEWIGESASIALGGQDISSSFFVGQIVSGIGTGTLPVFERCSFLATTLPALTRARSCNIGGNITLGAASTYTFRECHTTILGANPPILDFGAAIAGTTVNMRDYDGHVEIQNMGQVAGNDRLFFGNNGELTINANCLATGTPPDITVRGNVKVTNNGTVVVLAEQAVTLPTIQAQILTDATPFAGANIDAAISSRLATAGYTAPDNTGIGNIKVQTDKLTFTVANKVDANTQTMNNEPIQGKGVSGNLWRGVP